MTAPGGCDWSAAESAGWISLSSSSGIGDGSIRYTVSQNSTGSERTAVISIAGKTHTVTQGTCTISVSPENLDYTYTGGAGVITVTTPSGCDWSVSEAVDWITITSGGNGSGNGTVSYSVSANSSAVSRSGEINVAGQPHTVTQGPAPCTYRISPTSRSIDASGGTYSIAVTAPGGCDWTASESASWLRITPTSDSGDGTVTVTVDRNTGAARSATITIAGQAHRVSQSAADCTYTIDPTSRSVAAGGASYDVDVDASYASCGWTASESASWIRITPTSDSGDGTVTVTVDPVSYTHLTLPTTPY